MPRQSTLHLSWHHLGKFWEFLWDRNNKQIFRKTPLVSIDEGNSASSKEESNTETTSDESVGEPEAPREIPVFKALQLLKSAPPEDKPVEAPPEKTPISTKKPTITEPERYSLPTIPPFNRSKSELHTQKITPEIERSRSMNQEQHNDNIVAIEDIKVRILIYTDH